MEHSVKFKIYSLKTICRGSRFPDNAEFGKESRLTFRNCFLGTSIFVQFYFNGLFVQQRTQFSRMNHKSALVWLIAS